MWQTRAACRGHPDPDTWYPDKGRTGAGARRICATCPVRAECLAAALDGASVWAGIDSGIWGGTSARERARMRGAPGGK